MWRGTFPPTHSSRVMGNLLAICRGARLDFPHVPQYPSQPLYRSGPNKVCGHFTQGLCIQAVSLKLGLLPPGLLLFTEEGKIIFCMQQVSLLFKETHGQSQSK